MNKSKKGKVILVVGGAGSIGAVCARLFADAGHQIPSFDSFFDPEM